MLTAQERWEWLKDAASTKRNDFQRMHRCESKGGSCPLHAPHSHHLDIYLPFPSELGTDVGLVPATGEIWSYLNYITQSTLSTVWEERMDWGGAHHEDHFTKPRLAVKRTAISGGKEEGGREPSELHLDCTQKFQYGSKEGMQLYWMHIQCISWKEMQLYQNVLTITSYYLFIMMMTVFLSHPFSKEIKAAYTLLSSPFSSSQHHCELG